MPDASCRQSAGRGLTLVEVVAGLALLATLLASNLRRFRQPGGTDLRPAATGGRQSSWPIDSWGSGAHRALRRQSGPSRLFPEMTRGVVARWTASRANWKRPASSPFA